MQLRKLRVKFDRVSLDNVEKAVQEQFRQQKDLFPSGARIAVGVGSRGIANLSAIVKASVASLREFGAEPFIVPAMGSHGGATGEGQAQVLASSGVTEEEVGCPIRSSMEVVELPGEGLPHKLFMDREAHESDGVLLINRVKPHTDFHGPHESGLAKMAVIGLGKEKQAAEMHRFGVPGLRDMVPKAAERIFSNGKVIAGLAIVENAYEETCRLELIPSGGIMEREPALLELSRKNMPRLPVDSLHVLIVDSLGKNISGSGMDTNIIGRIRIFSEPEPRSPRIHSILVDAITAESHGNATGLGLADVVTQRFEDQIDWDTTYRNLITSTFLERAKLPLVAETAAQGFEIALRYCGAVPPGCERVIRILHTLHLGEIYASPAVCDELKGREDIEFIGEPQEVFDSAGNLRPF